MGYACIYMDLNVISIERIKKITLSNEGFL